MRIITILFSLLIFSAIFGASIYAQESDTVRLIPIDDAFVIANLSDPDDIEGFQTTTTGNLDFLKSWYAWNITEHQEQLVTNSYLKFNLSDIESNKVINAQLKLVPIVLLTDSGVPPHLVLTKVETNDWNEFDINYANRPLPEKNFVLNTLVTNPDNQNAWYVWDVTDFVKQNSGSELSIVYSYGNIINNTEKVISFHSKETENPDNAPVLEIEYSIDDITNDTSEGGGCLIATATYGTELVPQIQQLRELRDNTLLQTESGKLFMNNFNNFYYSFSPYIADLERQNPLFKETVKIVITPLITSLSILNYVDIDSEAEIISYGISIIMLNLGMYVGIPAMLVHTARKLSS